MKPWLMTKVSLFIVGEMMVVLFLGTKALSSLPTIY
jgi:hypothetical protein